MFLLLQFKISFTGHQNILSTHKKTIEITKESELTKRGDCIVGVNSTCGCKDMPGRLKELLRGEKNTIKFTMQVGTEQFSFKARGNPTLELSHPEDIVIRKSVFTCPRTLAVSSTAASDSIPKNMVDLLKKSSTRGTLLVEVN